MTNNGIGLVSPIPGYAETVSAVGREYVLSTEDGDKTAITFHEIIPTIDEIRKIIDYPDRRMKPIIFTMASSGIRVGAWDHLKWSHVFAIMKQGKLLAARINVYAGEDDEYFTFVTPEAYLSLES